MKMIETFWNRYLSSLTLEDQTHIAYGLHEFGDNPELANELVGLVLDGKKTASCASLWEFEEENEPLPKVGDKNIVLNGQREPVGIVEITHVDVIPFNEVDAGFAYAEGEGDCTLDYWKQEHWQCFSRILPTIGKRPQDDMPLVCMKFKLIYDE